MNRFMATVAAVGLVACSAGSAFAQLSLQFGDQERQYGRPYYERPYERQYEQPYARSYEQPYARTYGRHYYKRHYGHHYGWQHGRHVRRGNWR